MIESFHSLDQDFTNNIGQILINLNAAAEYAFEDAVNIMCGK